MLITPYEMKKLSEEFKLEPTQTISVILNSAYDTIISSSPDICHECSNFEKAIRESKALHFEDTKLHIIEAPSKLYSYQSSQSREAYIGASHNTTVGELKLHICQTLDIDPSEQQLTYNSVGLDDDSKPLSYYKVTPLNAIHYKKKKLFTSGNLDKSGNLRISQNKETGFEGTILSGSRQVQKEPIKSPPSLDPQGWPRCKRCTFINDKNSPTKICSVCELDNS